MGIERHERYLRVRGRFAGGLALVMPGVKLVYLLINDNRVISMPITATPSNDGKFLVVTDGLRHGDRILLNGFNLRDSTVVTPLPVNTDSLYSNTK